MNADARGITTRNGLRADPAKTAAWQRRSAERYAAKIRARRSAARLTSSSRIDRKQRPAGDWSPLVRKMAGRRSGGVCEICTTARATDLHHRKLRRHGDHRIVNALHVCGRCHTAIHQTVRASYTAGYLVRAGQDPAAVPVVLADRRMLLTVDGDYEAAA